MNELGIDASGWNVYNSNTLVSNNVKFVIHKATQSVNLKDRLYPITLKQDLDAGLLRGSYHFGTGDDPIQQANFYIENVGVDHLLALDLEPNPYGKRMDLVHAEKFIGQINALTGRYPILYTGEYYLKEIGFTPASTLVNCPLWIADYNAVCPKIPGWDRVAIWQYSNGVQGNMPRRLKGCNRLDLNQFMGENLQEFWDYNSGKTIETF